MYEPPNPLTGLRKTIKAHWTEHRPKMTAKLRAAGKLDEAVDAAFSLTANEYHDLMNKGLTVDQAWEMVRETWALVPDEEDSPSLSFDPMTLKDLVTEIPAE
jgi:hypothetical protein